MDSMSEEEEKVTKPKSANYKAYQKEYQRNWRLKQKEIQEKSSNEIKLKIPDNTQSFGFRNEILDKDVVQKGIYNSFVILNEIFDKIVSKEDIKIIREEFDELPNAIAKFTYGLGALKEILLTHFNV
jgi:hypothetical protein